MTSNTHTSMAIEAGVVANDLFLFIIFFPFVYVTADVKGVLGSEVPHRLPQSLRWYLNTC